MIDGRGGAGYCLNCKKGPLNRQDCYCVECILDDQGLRPEGHFKCLACGNPVQTDLDRYCNPCIDAVPSSGDDPRVQAHAQKTIEDGLIAPGVTLGDLRRHASECMCWLCSPLKGGRSNVGS